MCFLKHVHTFLHAFQLESISLFMKGFDRYRDNHTLDDSQALELVYLLRQYHSTSLKVANLGGGHQWSKAVLAKAIKHLVPLPYLTSLILPIEGKEHSHGHRPLVTTSDHCRPQQGVCRKISTVQAEQPRLCL